jgi:hypothetical protein
MNSKTGIIVLLIAGLCLGIGVTTPPRPQPIMVQDSENFWSIGLGVDVTRDGEMVNTQYVENDYLLRNFAYIFMNMFRGDSASIELRETDGTYKGGFGTFALHFSRNTADVIVGSSDTAVALDDYALGNQVQAENVEEWYLSNISNEYNITVISNIAANADYNLKEVGIIVVLDNADNYYLLCRDVITTVPISTGDIITVRYVWRFNVGL